MKSALPPGPELAPLMQEMALRTRQREYILECQRTFGDAFTLRLPSRPMVCVTTREAAKDLLTLSEEEYFHPVPTDQLFLSIMGSSSLLFLRGAAHKRLRDMMIKVYSSERSESYLGLMNGVIEKEIRALPRGRPIALYPALEHIAWKCIVQLTLGTDDPSRVEPAVQQLEEMRNVAIHSVLFKLMRPGGKMRFDRLQRALPWVTPWGRFLRRMRRLDALFAREAERIRNEPENVGLLAAILKARDGNGQPMTPSELRDSIMVLLTGGIETVSSTSTQLMFRLFEQPALLTRLQDELRAPAPEGAFSMGHLRRLTFLDSAVKESMRLDPAFCQIQRTLKVPAQIGGVDVPADTTVAVLTYAIHHREDIWPNAEKFDPERFVGAKVGPFDMLPFSAGPHRCAGAHLGTLEVKLMIGHLLSACDVSLAPGFAGKIVPEGPVWSATGGLPVVISDRRS